MENLSFTRIPTHAGDIRAVVVGYGMAGKGFHCYLINLTDGLALRGVVSRSAGTRETIAREQRCAVYDSFDSAIDDPETDLIVIATPNSTHADLAVRAIEAGKHVVTDKVMCLTLADCDRMIDAASAAGVMLSVFQNRRFDGDYLTVRRLIEDGTLGDVRWIEMAWQGFGASGGWRGEAAMGGGKYHDLGAHLVDQLCMFFPGPVESVYCRMRHDFEETDTESEALLVVTFDGGRTGVCDFSSLAAISKPRFYVKGTGGTFRKYGVDSQEAAMFAGDIDGAREDPESFGVFHDGREERTVPTMPGRWRNYYENIVDVLGGVAAPLVTLEEVRREIAVLEAGLRSARNNKVITNVVE